MLRYLGYGPRDYGNHPLLPMRRQAWEFQAVTAGQCAAVTDIHDKPIMRSLTLWLFPPQHLHGWTAYKCKPCRIFVAHFDVVPAALDTGRAIETPLTRTEARRLDALAKELVPHHRTPNSHSRIHIDRAKIELALLVLKNTAPAPVHYDEQRVDAAVAWYHQNMARRVTVNDMAEMAHVSVAHLRRLFVRYRKKPPQAVMRQLQVQRAQELMMTTQLPLTDIAHACGFSCLSVFSRSHQEVTGIAPSAWRRTCRGGG